MPDRHERDERVAELVRVQEGRRRTSARPRRRPGPVHVRDSPDPGLRLGGVDQHRDHADEDQPEGRVRARVRRDAGDLVRAQPGQLARAAAAALGGLAAGAVDLRRPLADPLPAVRALGHVRAHLGAAVLADDEQVGLRHGLPQSTRRAEPVRWLLAGRLGRLGHRGVEDLAELPRGGRGWPRRPCAGATPRCPLSRMSSRQSKSASEPSSSACGRSRSITRRASSGTGTRSCFGRSTSSPSSPWRAASHLFSSSISYG